MANKPETSTCSIVLVGQFNPAIFHPAWLEGKGIEQEALDSDDDLLSHRDIAKFSIDTRSYLVRADRFQIETRSAPWVTILDIATKIFGEHLIHTPIVGFGINRTVHFGLPNVSSRIRLGRRLAPTEPWGQFGQGMDTDDISLTGGLQRLVMRRKSIVNGNSLETNVTIEPSVRITDNTGVYMHINGHHMLANLPKGHGSEQAINFLAERFEVAIEEAETVIEDMMEKRKRTMSAHAHSPALSVQMEDGFSFLH